MIPVPDICDTPLEAERAAMPRCAEDRTRLTDAAMRRRSISAAIASEPAAARWGSPALLLLTALLLVTGTALAGLAAQLRPAAIAAPATAAASEAAVRRFYAAANVAISSGEVALLRAVMAPDFVDRSLRPGTDAGRAGLEARVLELHVADPDARLVVEELVPAGDRVVARVTGHAGAGWTPAGLAVVGPVSVWAPVEVLRVRAGLLVERWAAMDGVVEPGPAHELRLAMAAPARRALTVARLTLAPGAELRARADDGPLALLAEDGAVAVDVEAAGLGPAPPDGVPPSGVGRTGERSEQTERVRLSPGESVILPDGARYRLGNDGAAPARVLAIAAVVPPIGGSADPPPEPLPPPPGVASELLAPARAAPLPAGEAIVGLMRVALTPGARLALAGGSGPVVLAVEAGQLGVASEGGGWARRAGLTTALAAARAALGPGDGLLVPEAGPLLLWNASADPAVVLVVAVRPVAS